MKIIYWHLIEGVRLVSGLMVWLYLIMRFNALPQIIFISALAIVWAVIDIRPNEVPNEK